MAKVVFDGEWKLVKAHKLIVYLYSIVFLGVFLFFCYGQFVIDSPSLFEHSCEVYEGVWNWERSDGYSAVIGSFPTDVKIAKGESILVSTVLPDNIKDNTYFCMLSGRSMKATIDGKIRFEYKNASNPLGFSVKSRYMPIALKSSDAGKTLFIYRDDLDGDNGEFNTVLYGNGLGIIFYILRGNVGQFVFALFLLLISIMTMLFGYSLLFIYKRKNPLVLLAYATAVTALWTIADSFLYQIAFQNFFVDGPLEYMLVMLIPFNFGRYLNYIQKGRYEKFYLGTFILMLFEVILFSALHFGKILPYQSAMGIISLSLAIVLIIYIASFLVDIVRGYIKEYRLVVIGFAGLIVAAIVEMVILNVSVDVHYADFLLVGLLFLLIMGTIHTVYNLMKEQEEARRAVHTNQLKTNFLANMSHEIRTPINAVLGMNEMILRECEDEQILRYSGDIQAAGDSLLSIVNDILDFSKIEAGRMDIVNKDYFLGDMLVNTFLMMRIRAASKDLAFLVDVDPHIPDHLFGDSDRLQQVLVNVINNAIKYTREGSVTVRVRELSREVDRVLIQIAVEDTGIGISESDKDNLFHLFERLDLNKNRNIEGTGLGLAITKNLLELMDGSITVDSIYGEGSTFTIVIPQRFMGEAEIGSIAVREEAKAVKKKKEPVMFTAPDVKILAVDDLQVNLNVIQGLLKRSQMRVDTALSGEQCLKMCGSADYNLILMDHMMPGKDGIETLHALQQLWKSGVGVPCPVIVLTANAIDGMKEMYLSEGFTDYLSKPTKPVDLTDMLLKYLPAEKVH